MSIPLRERRVRFDGQRVKHCEDGGIDWSDRATNQGISAVIKSWKKPSTDFFFLSF